MMSNEEPEPSLAAVALALRRALGFMPQRKLPFSLVCWVLEWYFNAKEEGVGIYAVPLDSVESPFVRGEGVELRRLGTIALSLAACPYKVPGQNGSRMRLICPTEVYVLHRVAADRCHLVISELNRYGRGSKKEVMNAWASLRSHERRADRMQSAPTFNLCSTWLAARFADCSDEDSSFIPAAVTSGG